jgi:hypothetical protein
MAVQNIPTGKENTIPTPLLVLGIFIALLLAVASGGGLLFKNMYDPFISGPLLSMVSGQDLLSLFCVPVLLSAIYSAWRKSILGSMVWTGILIYVIYAYSLLAFGAVYTYLYFLYIALIGLSAYSIIYSIQSIDFGVYQNILDSEWSRKGKGSYFIVTGTVISLVWLIILFRTIFTKVPIIGISTVYVLDLTLLLPAFIITGIQLLRRSIWSYYAAGVLLVKAVTLGMSIILGNIVAVMNGWHIIIGLCFMFSLFTVIGGILLYADIRKLRKKT